MCKVNEFIGEVQSPWVAIHLGYQVLYKDEAMNVWGVSFYNKAAIFYKREGDEFKNRGSIDFRRVSIDKFSRSIKKYHDLFIATN